MKFRRPKFLIISVWHSIRNPKNFPAAFGGRFEALSLASIHLLCHFRAFQWPVLWVTFLVPSRHQTAHKSHCNQCKPQKFSAAFGGEWLWKDDVTKIMKRWRHGQIIKSWSHEQIMKRWRREQIKMMTSRTDYEMMTSRTIMKWWRHEQIMKRWRREQIMKWWRHEQIMKWWRHEQIMKRRLWNGYNSGLF